MMIDAEARYLQSHEWARKEADNIFVIGLSAYAIEQLGDIVYMELPEVGSEFKKTEPMGVVESVKTAADMYTPLSGKVVEINEAIPDNPDVLKTDAYKEGWLIKVEASDPSEVEILMDADAYRKFIETEA